MKRISIVRAVLTYFLFTILWTNFCLVNATNAEKQKNGFFKKCCSGKYKEHIVKKEEQDKIEEKRIQEEIENEDNFKLKKQQSKQNMNLFKKLPHHAIAIIFYDYLFVEEVLKFVSSCRASFENLFFIMGENNSPKLSWIRNQLNIGMDTKILHHNILKIKNEFQKYETKTFDANTILYDKPDLHYPITLENLQGRWYYNHKCTQIIDNCMANLSKGENICLEHIHEKPDKFVANSRILMKNGHQLLWTGTDKYGIKTSVVWSPFRIGIQKQLHHPIILEDLQGDWMGSDGHRHIVKGTKLKREYTYRRTRTSKGGMFSHQHHTTFTRKKMPLKVLEETENEFILNGFTLTKTSKEVRFTHPMYPENSELWTRTGIPPQKITTEAMHKLNIRLLISMNLTLNKIVEKYPWFFNFYANTHFIVD